MIKYYPHLPRSAGEKVEEDISLKTVAGECQGRAKELKGITNEFVLRVQGSHTEKGCFGNMLYLSPLHKNNT